MSADFVGQVALDGPSGTGKSSVARAVAARLGAAYLDTGAMYRAATVAVLDAGVDPEDAEAVARVVARARIEVGTHADTELVAVDGTDVAVRIRGAEVTRAVSAVSLATAPRAVLRDLRPTARAVAIGLALGAVMTLLTYPAFQLARLLYAGLDVYVKALYVGARLYDTSLKSRLQRLQYAMKGAA